MKERFFYTTNTPYKWSSGPSIHYWNLISKTDMREIASLDEARDLARKHRVHSMGIDCVTTTYGIEYTEE